MSSKRGRAALGSILLLSHVSPTISSNPNFDNAPHGKCPGGLKCHHGGKCATGDKDDALEHPVVSADIPWLEELNINGEHCTDCHDGWGGVDCGRRYQVCDASDPHAPTCFNGSSCYKMGISASTGKYEYMCDCRHAGSGEVRYAGKFCQHVQEEQCDEEMFCTNGGKCTSTTDLDGIHAHFVCDCPAHRAGTHCEFLQEEGFSHQKNEHKKCNLDCDRGVCAKGFKSYDNLIGTGPFPAKLAFDIISSSGEHCVCPDGYTGLRCEVPVERCGPKKYCYNGSTCAYDDQGRPMCDCNSAHTDDVSYAGVSCEQESTSHCTPGLDQDQKDSFCTNHGRCKEDPETRHEGCVCDEGWTGDLCDFKVIQGESKPVCDLDCNGGSCRFGVKGYKDSYDALNLPVHAKKQEDGMFCSCPDGFTGLKCEVDMNHCRDTDGSQSPEHFCLNGVSCAPDDIQEVFDGVEGRKKFSCQCDEHEKDDLTHTLAGRFCEYAVTEFCSENEERHNHSWCTNGGKCKKYNDHHDNDHHGCCCPDGYEGDFCQFPEGTLDLETEYITWSPMGECKHEKKSSPQRVFPVNGEWEHIKINPKYQVPAEKAEPVMDSIEPDAPQKKTGGIVTGVLLFVLLSATLAGVLHHKGLKKDDPAQFAADWWKGHTAEWWKGDSPIESDTNIAPASIPKHIKGSWSYHTEGSKKWDSDDDDCSLHDVVI